MKERMKGRLEKEKRKNIKKCKKKSRKKNSQMSGICHCVTCILSFLNLVGVTKGACRKKM